MLRWVTFVRSGQERSRGEREGATVWTIRDGEIVAVKMYQSKEEALEARLSRALRATRRSFGAKS